MVAGLRRLRPVGPAPTERRRQRRRRTGSPPSAATSAARPLDPDHRHLLHLVDRRDPLRLRELPRAARRRSRAAPDRHADVWLDDFELPTRSGRRSGSRSGSRSSSTRAPPGGVVALYPSPAGATESELELEAWRELRALNPVLMRLEPDAEALIVNRMAEPPQYAIAPIDECYRLVGLIKVELGRDLRRRRARARDRRLLRRAARAGRRACNRRRDDRQQRAPSVAELEPSPFTGAPDPDFEVLSARAVARAAAPTVGFRSGSATAPGGACSRSRSRS